MRIRQISSQKYINNCEYIKPSSNQIYLNNPKSSQISNRGSLSVKPCLKKLSSSIFSQIQSSQIGNESISQLQDQKNEHKVAQRLNIIQKQLMKGEYKINESFNGHFKMSINDSTNDNSFCNNKFIHNNNHKKSNSKINSSRVSVISILSRFRSITNDEERKNSSYSSQKRDEQISPSMRKKILHYKDSSQLNHQNSVTFITSNLEENDKQSKERQKRSFSSNILDKNKNLLRQSILAERKKQQCQQIKKAFTLLPNNKYLQLEDDKIISIRTPISSSTSSSSIDSSSSQEKSQQIISFNIQNQNQTHQNLYQIKSNHNLSTQNVYYSASNLNETMLNMNQNTSNLNQSSLSNLQKPLKLNESSKQFLKQFIKERKIQEKQRNNIKKSDHVRQIQQTILNKVLNEMNKEKESQIIIKDFEDVQSNQKIKKVIPNQSFKPLVHFRTKDTFCQNKNVISQVNQGVHKSKSLLSISKIVQEENKHLTVHCKKQNFFGSLARRNLNVGVPQIIQNLQSIKN